MTHLPIQLNIKLLRELKTFISEIKLKNNKTVNQGPLKGRDSTYLISYALFLIGNGFTNSMYTQNNRYLKEYRGNMPVYKNPIY